MRQDRRMEDDVGPSVPDAIVRAGLSLVPGIGGALAELYQVARDLGPEQAFDWRGGGGRVVGAGISAG